MALPPIVVDYPQGSLRLTPYWAELPFLGLTPASLYVASPFHLFYTIYGAKTPGDSLPYQKGFPLEDKNLVVISILTRRVSLPLNKNVSVPAQELYGVMLAVDDASDQSLQEFMRIQRDYKAARETYDAAMRQRLIRQYADHT